MDEQTTASNPAAAAGARVPAGVGGRWAGTRFPARARTVRARRRAGRGGVAVRARLVQVRLTSVGFAGVDARAARARLGVGAWVALLGEDVALDRPAVSSGLLEAVGSAGERLRRIGGVLNAVAVGENIGRVVPEGQLGPVLARVAEAVAGAEEVLAELAGVYAQAAAGGGQVGGGSGRRGRRAAVPDEVGVRDRRVGVRLSAGEFEALAAAAGGAGLAVGAWLGAVVEDPDGGRPAITGQVWGAVFGLRRGLRGVGTNLAQISAARAGRGAGPLPELSGVIGRVDAAIRLSLGVSDAITTAGRRGVAG